MNPSSGNESDQVRIQLLGPIASWRGAQRIRLAGWRQPSVLAVLALSAGHIVTFTELAEAVWGDEPPTTVRQQIHSSVSALRGVLGELIVTGQAGYELAVPVEQVDALVFQSLVASARQAEHEGQLQLAADRLAAALALWNGPALAGVPNLRVLAVGLEEERLSALEKRITAELQLGRHRELVAELSALVAKYPVREHLIGQLMIALSRSGRVTDALEIYRKTRQRLADELGLEPGPELAQLELSLLRGEVAAEPAWAGLRPDGLSQAVRGPPRVIPSSPLLLPPDNAGFTGRADQMAEIQRLLSMNVPPMLLITGLPGVGKTTLAVHCAHRAATSFPDGQLYVDLGGFGPVGPALASAAALRGSLSAPGAPYAGHTPPGPLAMGILLRAVAAGRRMIIVLDNARDWEQG